MDETEAVKAGMEVILRPMTDVAENAIGLLGGDWLSEKRRCNRERLKARTDEILHERKIEHPVEPPPAILLPLLQEAQEESRETLVDIWAKLVAAAMDPARVDSYRREYVEVAKQLEPVDTLVLPLLSMPGNMSPTRREYIASRLGISTDAVQISFRNLERLELIANGLTPTAGTTPFLTPFGRQFLFLVS